MNISVNPVAPYQGGKIRLAKTIIQKIQKIKHKNYAEPFVGMGGIFLRRPERARAEFINDFNLEIANFFRILQRHYIPFMEMMRFQITTRAEFERLSQSKPETLTDLERASRFLYLQRTGFSGKIYSKTFGVSKNQAARFDIMKLAPMLEDLHERLSSVVIERLHYADFIKKYDTPQTLFYLDPPYYGCEKYYGKDMFYRDDFQVIADNLKSMAGNFILSINDTNEIREIYADFNIEEVNTIYSTGTISGNSNVKTELLISNI